MAMPGLSDGVSATSISSGLRSSRTTDISGALLSNLEMRESVR